MARPQAKSGRIGSAGLNPPQPLFVRRLRRNREDETGNGDRGIGYKGQGGEQESVVKAISLIEGF